MFLPQIDYVQYFSKSIFMMNQVSTVTEVIKGYSEIQKEIEIKYEYTRILTHLPFTHDWLKW
jgi:hypothetical protein